MIPLFLSLDKSQSNAVIINGEMVVSGMTLPDTTVVVYSPLDAASTESDGHGYFEQSVVVGSEDTQVQVTAYGENGEEQSVTLDVKKAPELSYVGRPQVLGKSTTALEHANNGNRPTTAGNQRIATDSTQPTPTVRQKNVQEFLSIKRPTYKQPKIGLPKMKDLLATDATNSAKVTRQFAVRAARLTDATDSAKLAGRKAVAGVITAMDANSITVAHIIDRTRTTKVYFNADTVVSIKGVANATTLNLALAQRVAVVGDRVPDGILAVHIHVIPGKATGVFNRLPVASGSGSASDSGFTATPTPSAQISAAPTATPFITATPTEVPLESPTETVAPIASPTPTL